MTKGQLEFDAVVSTDQLNKLLGDLRTNATGAAKAINDALGGTVSKKIVLETVADANGVKQLVAVEKERLSVADKIKSTQDKINKIEAGSVTSLRQQVNEAKQARDQLVKYEESVGRLGLKIRQLNGDWVVANQRVQDISRQLDVASASGFWQKAKVGLNAQGLVDFGNGLSQITQALQAASILVGGVVSQINNLVNAVAKLQSFKLSFVASGAGGSGGAQALQEASRVALGLGANLNVVRDGFQKLTPVVLNSGGSLSNVSQISEALSSRFAAFGLSADASRRVMNGVIQAFAKGKLQAEELTQQISEADPAFKTDFANALGVTVQQLEALVKAGKITTDVLISTLPALSKSALLYGQLGSSATSAVSALGKFDAATGRTAATTEQVRTQLETLSQLNFERLATAFQPFIAAFLRAQAVVIDFITYITKLEGIRGLGNILGALSQSIVNLLDAITRIVAVIATVISPILQLTGAILNTGPGVVALTALIGVKLIGALSALPAAIAAGQTAFATLGARLSETVAKYLGLGSAAKTAAADVVASQAAIKAAAAGGAGAAAASGPAYLPASSVKQAAEANQALSNTAKAAAGSNAALNQQLIANAMSNAAVATAAKGSAAATGIFGKVVNGLSSALSAVKTPMTGMNAGLAVITAGLMVYGESQKTVDGILSGAKGINDDLKASIGDVNSEISKVTGKVIASGNAWNASVENVGQGAAAYDRVAQGINRFLGPLRLITNEEAKYNQSTIAAADASETFSQKIGSLVSKYRQMKESSDGSAKSRLKEKQTEESISNLYAARIGSLQLLIDKEKARATVSNEVKESKERLIAVLSSEKQALEAEAKAGGFNIEVMKEQAEAAKTLATEIKAINDAQIERIRSEKEQSKIGFDVQQLGIDESKRKEQERYDSAKTELSKLKTATQDYYNGQKEAIRQVRDAESERANAAIRNLQALTPAEQELQRLRILDLQAQAGQGGREGLEAKAQLERIRANEEIARIQEQERQNEEEAKRKVAKLEKEEKDSLRAIAAEERKQEAEHKEKMRNIDEASRKNKEAERQTMLAYDKEISTLQAQIKEAGDGAAKAAGEFTGEMQNASTAATAVRDKMQEIKTIASQIKIPSTENRFTGGPVTGGGRYTVNEFGREMFLSASGKLSTIKTKPWGTWTAPSSGTIIPAHIAAGLNVPTGGVQVSRSSAGLIDRSLTGSGPVNRMIGRMVAAINASSNSASTQNLAASQASQAVQLGKLTHAVNNLVEKDWNVQVNVRNSGDSLGYARAINRRI